MKLDDFEAVFKSSYKERFSLALPEVRTVLLLTDLPEDEEHMLEVTVRSFLGSLGDDVEWRTVGAGSYASVPECLGVVESARPDLLITYRHLLSPTKTLLYSLGAIVDTLTQATTTPVLLLPAPTRSDFVERTSTLERVLVVTDHIIGDQRLVSWGVRMCPPSGTLLLAHVEDDATFAYYTKMIEMIPDVDTKLFEKRLRAKLLGRPVDYIETVREAIDAADLQETVVPIVTMGHALTDYKAIVEEHDVHLVVMNTKDERQYAMHGMAHAIAVEIQDRPMLLL